MPRMTPSFAKNIIRRTLRAVLDPEPPSHEIDRLWEYFDSACAYCDQKLNRYNREGDIDHLIAGGTNNISNRVLSCKSCNGDKKLDKDWLAFLREGSPDGTIFRKRHDRITSWCRTNKPLKETRLSPAVQQEIDQAVLAFDTAYLRLYRLRDASN